MTLQELAENHCQVQSLMNYIQGDYSFTVDQLRALIREVAGEPVNYSGKCLTCNGTGELDDADLGDIYYNTWTCPTCNGARTAPLYAIPDEILK